MNKRHAYLFEHEVDTSKPKKTVKEEIFSKQYEGEDREIPVEDLPKDLEPTDLLVYISDPEFFSENNSYDAHTIVKILRPRLENSEEYSERLRLSAEFLNKAKERRYEVWMKLNKEFNPTDEKKS